MASKDVIHKTLYGIEPRLKGLVNAPIYSFAQLNRHDTEAKKDSVVDRAQKYFAERANLSPRNLKMNEQSFDKKQFEDFVRLAVSDGCMGRRWLDELLKIVKDRYAEPQQLIQELFPNEGRAITEPRHNVPTALINTVHEKSRTLDSLLEAMRRQAAVVVLIGKDGEGKTHLLVNTALHFWQTDKIYQRIIYADCISRERGKHYLCDQVLREIGQRNFVEWTPKQKMEVITNFCRETSVLLLIDWADRELDQDFCSWLERIPSPSKVVLAIRKLEDNHSLKESVVYCQFDPMRTYDYDFAVQPTLAALAQYNPDIDLARVDRAILGNPLAMRLLQAYVQYEKWRPLTLYYSINSLEEIVLQSHSVLSSAAKAIFVALIPFPLAANVESLRYVADPSMPPQEFDSALKELTDLYLVQAVKDGAGKPVSVLWHHVVRKVSKDIADKENGLRHEIERRWVKRYCQLAESVGFCPQDLNRLTLLDAEMETFPLVVSFVAEHKGYEEEALRLGKATYYYYVRGYWSHLQSPHLVAADAAKVLGRVDDEIAHRAYELEWALKREGMSVASLNKLRAELRDLVARHQKLAPESRIVYLLTMGYDCLTQAKASGGEYAQAEAYLAEGEALAESIGSMQRFLGKVRMAWCHFYRAMSHRNARDHVVEPNKVFDDARKYLADSIRLTEPHDPRTATSMRQLLALLLLACIPQAQFGKRDLLEIKQLVDDISAFVEKLDDKLQRARLLHVRGWYTVAAGQYYAGLDDLNLAKQSYENLGRQTFADDVDALIRRMQS